MSLVIYFCLAGVCKTHEIPLPRPVDRATCYALGQAKILELSPSYRGHVAERFGCVKGIAT